MSLADQSQKWFPTSVQVTVHQARNLRTKGKNGTNDAYAIIQVAKDKFSTSVAEKCVAPVWKEEASFDLPLFHPGNAERCTLYVVVMHRAQVGLDKFLGQAVVNLLDLHDNNTRKKTDWFKLVDKSKKEDKVRGEVLMDITFMRNNMSASMFDLSMQDKPRSRISKLKDKVRGKKKDGFSDSASAIVPHVSHVLTDSEGEPDAQSLNQVPGEKKKKNKLKTLFAPKSNLQRNISQSMSTLGTLPEKNSSLSSSRSSGLNIDSPEGKKKFKFLGHKRTGSSDSKGSLGPFSLLGRSKQSTGDQNSLCINGNHVYAEETEPKSGSTLSLNSSGQGSVEDVRKQAFDIPPPTVHLEPAQSTMQEQRRHQEDEERRQAEDRRVAEAKQQLQEEEDNRKRRILEDEARRKKQREEEEERRKHEEESRTHEEERRALEEKQRLEEEKKRQEEASMSDRLSSLFGMIKKKEEKKEEVVQQEAKEELALFSDSKAPEPISQRSSNPFEDIPLSSDLTVSSNESTADHHKSSHNPQPPSATLFQNRTAKVSAVKPSRLAQSPASEPSECQTLSLSPAGSESTLSSVPSESPDTFSNLSSSLAAANISPSVSPRGSTEDLSTVGSSPTMTDKKKRAPLPPSHPVREIKNPAYVDADGSQQGRSIPLPDYETLFPQKRHGVQGHTGWDHLIAEVNQRQRDLPPQFVGPEMSVDGPEDHEPIVRSSVPRESPTGRNYQTQPQETKPVSSKKATAPSPPKHPRSAVDSSPSQDIAYRPHMRHGSSADPGPLNPDASSRESLSAVSRDGRKKVLPSSATPRPTSQLDRDATPPDYQSRVSESKEAPTAKPRQKISDNEPRRDSFDKAAMENKENFTEFDPFPSTNLLSKDPWAQPNQRTEDPFSGRTAKEQKPEDRGMSAGDLDHIFTQDKPMDPFAGFNNGGTNGHGEHREKEDVSKPVSPTFQRRNSQKQKQNRSPTSRSENKSSKSRQEPAYKEEEATVPTANQVPSARDYMSAITSKPQADMKKPSNLYRGEDPFAAEPTSVTSISSEPLPVVMEEPASYAGGKAPLKAWVSPSDVQTVSAQNSNGGGLAFSQRRPHPVKPMSSGESQYPISTPGVKDIKVRDSTAGRIQVADPVGSGPYTQLTQEELITLVVKQQADLSRKDGKICELEEYIDNLIVRIIEEKPAILQSINSKPV